MALESEVREAQAAAAPQWLRPESGIVLVGVGYKEVVGTPTSDLSVVFGVVEKKPEAAVRSSDLVPRSLHGISTDVIETGEIIAYRTTRQRPAPGGWSVGHFRITAGTLGMVVLRNSRPYILSNNHVLANSNDARTGDAIYQPGPRDGGTRADQIAILSDWIPIQFENEKGKRGASDFLWRAAKWVPNAIARLVGCPRRLTMTTVPRALPNEVDAALALVPIPSEVTLGVDGLGRPRGLRDFSLGDLAAKSGRTTSITRNTVSLVQVATSVSYGGGRVARFRNQIGVRGNFSAPGDSGSVVLHADGAFGGLLFAGGQNITIVNMASRVRSLLMFDVP